MKRIVVRYFVYMLILMILCIFVDLIPSILEDPHWLEFLGVMVVVCFLAASLDVSYSELMMSVKGAKPKKIHCFWLFLVMIVIFSVWISYVITCEGLLVMSRFLMIRKVFPSLMLLLSLHLTFKFYSSDWLKSLVFSFYKKRKHLTLMLNFLHYRLWVRFYFVIHRY